MRSAVRKLVLGTIALISAALLGVGAMAVGALAWAATTLPIIVPGTGTPDPYIPARENYLGNAVSYYVTPAGACGVAGIDCGNPEGVLYPATFWPIPLPGWGGLEGDKWNVSVSQGLGYLTASYRDALGLNPGETREYDNVVVFGYSQGATISSIFKANLAAANNGLVPANTEFVLIGNPNRPNGGLFERLALLGTVPILEATFGQPTPTNTTPLQNGVRAINTTDIALQYDGVVDFPKYPINLLAVANAIAGFQYVHGTYLDPYTGLPDSEHPFGYTVQEVEDIVAGCAANPHGQYCQKSDDSDTVYVTLPARSLPIAQPFLDLASATKTDFLINPIVAALQPALQTLIETGYDRSDYSKASPFGIVPLVNPIKLVRDLVNDIPEGFDAAKSTIENGNKIPNLPGSPDPTSTQTQTVTTLVSDQEPAQLSLVVDNSKNADTPDAKSDFAPKTKVGKKLAAVLNPGNERPLAKLFGKTGTDATVATGAETAITEKKAERPRPLRAIVKEVKKAIGNLTGVRKAEANDAAPKQADQKEAA
ncbi:PE-PPE domain-containing protein [Mycolicibacterium brumae]|uniref:PE-PPE domain-containing protein n=1 Tax=Mycolicibacterium brumae TaxID=85968 RepID=A0A2G5PDA6_9MYCO|nr:PE-PPE domain-containing protein [Mycolicibacterium brumae]MCV7193474.1 PE-PPE domain-containing protein [Mycolicibacterium brumae]PIB76060.1 PE-PPE domain-containing protein [Mycolicibacterium brumae]RWA17173.1 hypothetical protein MBRU_05995 [Mycolicibacterium brumae DSM 44177]UWW09253.1 PE-PPE domain-containing protein [Mycolicibacterium brumae]